jgi:predicted amidophosphoribosyltransferase
MVGLVGLLLPERCAVCEAPGDALCAPCRDALVRLRPPVCDRCGSPGPWPVRRCAECSGRRLAFARARSALVYDARARALVREWKERGRRGLADEAAALVDEVVPRPEV